jgi:hypothetical protein
MIESKAVIPLSHQLYSSKFLAFFRGPFCPFKRAKFAKRFHNEPTLPPSQQHRMEPKKQCSKNAVELSTKLGD